MLIEILNDVIAGEQKYHEYMSVCMKHCANTQLNERAK
jgi:hypothetical protein